MWNHSHIQNIFYYQSDHVQYTFAVFPVKIQKAWLYLFIFIFLQAQMFLFESQKEML